MTKQQAKRLKKAIKTSWHLLIVTATAIEYGTAKTPFRRLVLGGCLGWHLAAVHIDAIDNDASAT